MPAAALASTPLVLTLGAVAGAAGVTSTWPQIGRLVRTRLTTGISLPSQLLGLLAVSGWLVHGALARDPAQVMANAVAILGAATSVALVLACRRDGRGARRAALAGSAWAGLLAAAYALGGPAWVAVVVVALTLVRMLPQAVLAGRAGASLRGLSPVATLLAATAAVLWLGYGLLVGDAAVVTSSTVATALNGFVAVRRCGPPLLTRWQSRVRVAEGSL